jgi:HAMP domain-containing protein
MRIGLKSLVFLGGALLMFTPAMVAGTMFADALQRRAETANAGRLRIMGELAAEQLGRRMHQLWRDVDEISRTIDIDDHGEMRRQFSFLGQIDPRYSWLGVANVEGKVISSSQGLLEGQSVAERPWFRRRLNGAAATDVHDAKLLEKLLPATAEPRRFVDFSVPVRDEGGAVQGVLGAHFDWNWVRENLGAFKSPGVDVLLLSRERRVLYGPGDLQETILSVGSAIAAGQATSISLNERWTDGKDYITVVVPTVQYRDMPSFGWSVIVRADTNAVLEPTRALVRSFWTMLGAGALVALGLLYLFASWLTKPLYRLVGSMEKLADGNVDQPPYEETRYEEASRLSAALVRLQSRSTRPYQKRNPLPTK